MTAPELSAADVAADLRSLGLGGGDRVVVHSSLRSIGPVAGGADAVVFALVEAVGPDGLVAVPTFTYDTPHFDPATTPGRTGALPEAVRRRPEAVRSLHPFYSVAAIGPGAIALVAGHELLAATAVDSPLGRLAAAGGQVLLLGVDETSNTTVHVGEFHAAVPYLDIPFDPVWPKAAEVRLPDGAALQFSYDRFPGCSRAFGVLTEPLERRGVMRIGRVGRSAAVLMPGAAVIEETVALLGADPAALLCRDPGCYRCTRARARLNRAAAPGREAAEDLAR